MVAFVGRYALTLPYWDQWELVPTLDRFFDGRLTFHDLWAQHNAHRIVFPRLVMLALARWTHWNIAWEIVANVVLAAAIFHVLVAYARQLPAFKRTALGAWMVPAIALLVFSLAQWRNLVWGWQMQVLMNVAAALAGLFVLTHKPLSIPRFVATVAFGAIATFSFASGLAYWVAALCVLPWSTPRPARWLVAWVAVSCVVIGSYLYGFEIASSHSSPHYAIDHVLSFIRYVLTFVGGSVVGIGNPHRVSTLAPFVVGTIGVATFAAMAMRAVRRKDLRVAAPLCGIALYVLGSATIAGLGRLEEGSGQALASRYVTVSAPFWVAWMLLACHTASDVPRRFRAPLAVAVACMLAAAVFNSARGANAGSQRCRFVLEARDALIAGENDDLLLRLYPQPDKVRALRPMLIKHRLTVFRDTRPE